MADTVVVPGAGAVLGFDLVTLPDGTSGVLVARQKVGFGTDGNYADVTGSVGLPVNLLNTSLAVTGSFYQTTQPVSIATMPSTPVTGTFWQATQPVSGTVTVSNFPATQPVSGTVAVTGAYQTTQPVSEADGANVTIGAKADTTWSGTGAGSLVALLKYIATSATAIGDNLIGRVKITDGTNLNTIKAGNVAAVATDTAQVVVNRDTVNIAAVDAPNLATGQVTVAASGGAGTNGATLIVAARAGRRGLTIITESTTAIRMGPTAVTVATGCLLPGTANTGFTFPSNFTGALYGITPSGTEAVSYIETY